MDSPERPKQPKFLSWIPAHLSVREKDELATAERHAVMEAEWKVLDDWHRRRGDIHAMPPDTLGSAKATARAAAREDFRSRVLAEFAKTPKADLPLRITRRPPSRLSSQ